MLRRYDQAIYDLLKLSMYGEHVPLTFATARKEYGQQTEIDQTSDVVLRSRADKNVKVPAMALSRLNWTYSTERQRFARHRKARYSHDLNLVAQAQHPIAYDILYQLDFLTKYRDDANLLVSQTIIKFPHRFARLTVDLGYPFGERAVFLRLGDVSDTTELEPGAENDRECRMTMDFLLEAWLPIGAQDVRTVRRVTVETDAYWHEDQRGLDAVVFKKDVEEG